MPQYYNRATETLVSANKELPKAAIRFEVGELKDVEFVGSAPEKGTRPLCTTARLGLGSLWAEPTYFSIASGQEVTGHFDLSAQANRDLRTVSHRKDVEVGMKFVNTAELAEEKPVSPAPR